MLLSSHPCSLNTRDGINSNRFHRDRSQPDVGAYQDCFPKLSVRLWICDLHEIPWSPSRTPTPGCLLRRGCAKYFLLRIFILSTFRRIAPWVSSRYFSPTVTARAWSRAWSRQGHQGISCIKIDQSCHTLWQFGEAILICGNIRLRAVPVEAIGPAIWVNTVEIHQTLGF